MLKRSKLRTLQIGTLGLLLVGYEIWSQDNLGARSIPVPRCRVVDAWEPNPSAYQATLISWEHAEPEGVETRDLKAYLCPEEEDWYLFETATLGFEDPHLLAWGLINNANLCSAACGNPDVTPGPNYALTIEVYRADNMQLLDSATSDNGEVLLGGSGDYDHDLLFRVFSPTLSAMYPYRLTAIVVDGPPGDDCEC